MITTLSNIGWSKGNLKSIRHIDHITYVCRPENQELFISNWSMLGFHVHSCLETSRFPARHTALVSGFEPGRPWGIMTGLSVSPDPASPINEFVRRYGEGQQHVAYNIDPAVDMEVVHRNMTRMGWSFMTPVLTYRDGAGARLRQMFTAPVQPYGTFIEFVQRLPGAGGEAYDGFDPTNVDDLYECYADYSAWLERRAPASAA